jgi:hypothetical protein
VRKVEGHISRYIVHNHKNQHNSAIDNHIIIFDLVEERRIRDCPTKLYDQEKILISFNLTLEVNVWQKSTVELD